MPDLVKVKVIEKGGFKATLVSVLPFSLNERKPGLYPGEFFIEAVHDPMTEFRLLAVGESCYYVPLALERPSYQVRIPAIGVAASIVNDYVNSVPLTSDEAHPGLFAVNENLHEKDVEEKYGDTLEEVRNKQLRWFEALVKMAADDYQKYRTHSVITDIQRVAARILNVNTEWSKDFVKQAMGNCPACRALVDPVAIICPNCKFVINKEEYAKLKGQFVE